MNTVSGIKVTYLDTEESIQDKIMSRAEIDALNTTIVSSAKELLRSGPGTYDDVDVGDDETEVVEMFRLNTLHRARLHRKIVESLGDEPPEINISNIEEVSAENQITVKTYFAQVLFNRISLSPEVPLVVSHNNQLRVHDTAVESLSRVEDVSQLLDPKTNMFSFLIKADEEIDYTPTQKMDPKDYVVVDVAFPIENNIDEMEDSDLDVRFYPPGNIKATETLSKRIQETLDIEDDVSSYAPMKKKSLELFYLYENGPAPAEINSALLDFMVMNDEVMSHIYVITGYKKSKNAITLKFRDTLEKVKIVEVDTAHSSTSAEDGPPRSTRIGIYYFAENDSRKKSVLQKIIASIEYYSSKKNNLEASLNAINNKVLQGFSLNAVGGYKKKETESDNEIGSNNAVKNFRRTMAEEAVAISITNNPLLSAKSCEEILLAETAELDISHWVSALQSAADSYIFAFSFDGNIVLPNLVDGFYTPQIEYQKCILLLVTEDSAINVIVDARYTNTGYVKTDTAILNEGNIGKLPEAFEPLFGATFFRLGIKNGYSRNRVVEGVLRGLKNSKFKTQFERNSDVFKAVHTIFLKNVAFYSGNQTGTVNRTLKNIDLDRVQYQGVDGSGKLRLVGFNVTDDQTVDIFFKPQSPLKNIEVVDLEKHKVKIADNEILEEMMNIFRIKWNVSKYPGKALFKIDGDQYAYVVTRQMDVGPSNTLSKLFRHKQKRRTERLLSQICLFRFSEFLTDENEDVYDVNEEMIETFMKNETLEEKSEEYEYNFSSLVEDNFEDEKILLPKNSTKAFTFFLKNKASDPLFVRTFKYSKYLDDFFQNGVRRIGDTYEMPLHAFSTWNNSRKNRKMVFHNKPVLIDTPYYLSLQRTLYYVQNFNTEDAALEHIENQKIYDPSKFMFSEKKGFENFLDASTDAVIIGFMSPDGPIYAAGIVPQFKL